MSEFKNKMITTKGMELLSKAISGETLEFTRIEMGAGEFVGDIGEAESLVQAKQNLPITKVTRKGSQVTLSAALKVEDITSEYDWTEIGVYARGKDGVEILYMYGHTQNSSFISKDSLDEKLINVTVLVSNVTEVTAVIDDSLVYLTAESLSQHEVDTNTHKDIRSQVESLKEYIKKIDISWEGITEKPETYPPTSHRHDKNEIDNFPTTLPANGGDAHTVGGKTFNWSWGTGSPTHIWGSGGDSSQQYVYKPASVSVGHADRATKADKSTYAQQDTALDQASLKNIIISPNNPSGGVNGNIWIKY